MVDFDTQKVILTLKKKPLEDVKRKKGAGDKHQGGSPF
jgi:hypothetical protein